MLRFNGKHKNGLNCITFSFFRGLECIFLKTKEIKDCIINDKCISYEIVLK